MFTKIKYDVVNNMVFRHVFTNVMYKITVSLRLHISMWLLANNKVLTRENMTNRRKVDDQSCLFCSELEIVNHFYDCCVVKSI